MLNLLTLSHKKHFRTLRSTSLVSRFIHYTQKGLKDPQIPRPITGRAQGTNLNAHLKENTVDKIKWDASSRLSFHPNSEWGSIETMTIGKTHPTLTQNNHFVYKKNFLSGKPTQIYRI